MLHDSKQPIFQKMGQSTWYSNCTAILCQRDSPSQRCDFATSFKTACASGLDAKKTRNTGDKKEGFDVEIGDVCDNIYLSSSVRFSTELPTDRPIEVTKTLLPTTPVPSTQITEKPTSTAHRQPAKVKTEQSTDVKTNTSSPKVLATTGTTDADNVDSTTPKPTDTRPEDKSTASKGPPLPTTLSSKSNKPSTSADDQPVKVSTTDGSEGKSDISGSPPTVVPTESSVSEDEATTATQDPDVDNVEGTTPKPTYTRTRDGPTVSDSSSKGPPLPTTLSPKSEKPSITTDDDQSVSLSTTDGSEGKSDISGSPPTVVPTENWVSDEQRSEDVASTRLSTPPMSTEDPSDKSNESDVKTNTSSEVIATTGTPDGDNVDGTTPKPTHIRPEDKSTASEGPPLPTTLLSKSNKPSTSADDQPIKVSTTDGSEGKSDISGSPPTVVPTDSSVSEDETTAATQDPDVDNVEGTTPKPTDTRTRDGPTVSDSPSKGPPLPTTLSRKAENPSVTTDDDQSVSLSTTDGSDENKSEITGSPPTVVPTENWVSDEQGSEDVASTRLSTPPMSTEDPSDKSNESDVKTNSSLSEVISTTGTPDGDNVDGTTPKPTDTQPEDKSTASKGPPLPTTLSSKSNRASTSAHDQQVKVSTTDGSEGKSDISGSPPTVVPTDSSVSEDEATTATQDPDVDNVESTTPKPTDTRTRDGPTVSDSSSKGPPLPTTLSSKSNKPSTSADDQPVKVFTTDGSEGKSDISGSPVTVVPTYSSVSEDEATTSTPDPDADNVEATTPKPTDTRTRDDPTVSDSSSKRPPLPTTLSPKSEKLSITTDDDQSVSLSTTDGSDEDKSEITGSPPTVVPTESSVSDEQRSEDVASARLSTPPMSTEDPSDDSKESGVKTHTASSEVISTTGTPDGDNVDGTTPKPTDTRPEDKSTASKGPPLPTTLSSKSNKASTSADDQPVKVSTTDGSEGKSDISGSPPTVVPTDSSVSEDEATTATQDPDVDNVEGTTPKPTDTRTRDGPTVSDSPSKGPPLPTTLSSKSNKPSTSADDQPVKVSTTDGSEGKSDISGSPPTVVPTDSSVSEDEATTSTPDPDADNVEGTTPKPTDTRTRDGSTVSDSSSKGPPLPTTLSRKAENPSITTDDDQSVRLSTTDGSDEDKSEITESPPTVIPTENWVSDEQGSEDVASTRLSTPPMSTEDPSDESNESDVKTNTSSSKEIVTTGTPDGDNVDGTTPKPTDTRPEDKSTASKGPPLPTTLSSKSNKASTSADDQPVKVSTTNGPEGKSDISGSPPTVVPTDSSVSEDEATTATQDPDVVNVEGTTPKPTDTRTRDGSTVSDSSSKGPPLPTTLSPKSEKPSITTDDDQSVSLSTTDGSDEDKSEITGSPPTVVPTENWVSDEQGSEDVASTRLSTPPMSTEDPSDESNESDVKTNTSSSEEIVTTGTPDGDNVDGTTPKPTNTRQKDKSTASKGPPLPTTLSSKSNKASTSADDQPVKVSTTNGSEGKSDISGSPPTVVPTDSSVSEDEATTATQDPDVDNVEGTTPKPTDTRTRDGSTVSDSSSKGPPLPTTLSPKSEKPSITTDDDQSVSLSTTDGSDEDKSEITGSPPTVVPTENWVSDEQGSEDVASTRLSTPPMSTEDPSDGSNESDVKTNTSSSEVISTTGTPDGDNVDGTTPKPTDTRQKDKSTASKGPPLPTTLSSKSNKASTSADDQPVKVSTTDGSEGKSDISGSPPTVVPTDSSVPEDEATTATHDPDVDNVEGTTPKPTDTRTRDGPTVSDSSSKGPPLPTTLSPKSNKPSTSADDQSVSLSTTDGSDEDKSEITGSPPTVVPTDSSVSEDEAATSTPDPEADNVEGTTPKPTDTRTRDGPTVSDSSSKGPPLPTTLSPKSEKPSITTDDDQSVSLSTTDGSDKDKSEITGSPPTVVPTENWVSDEQGSEDVASTRLSTPPMSTEDPSDDSKESDVKTNTSSSEVIVTTGTPDGDNVDGTTPKPTDTRPEDKSTASKGPPLPTTLSSKSNKSSTSADDQPVKVSTTEGKSDISGSPPTVVPTESSVSDKQSSEDEATTATPDPDADNVEGTTPKPTDTRTRDGVTVSDLSSKGPPLQTTLSPKSEKQYITTDDDQSVSLSTTDGSDQDKSEITGSPPTVVPTESSVSGEQSSDDKATTATPDPDADNVEGTTPKPTDTRTRDGPTVSDTSSNGPPLPTTLSPKSEKPSITTDDDQSVSLSTTDGSDQDKSDISKGPPTVVPTESSVSGEPRSDDIPSSKFSTPPISSEDPSTGGSHNPPTTEEVSFKATSSAPLKSVQLPSPVVFPCDDTSTDDITDGGNVANQTSGENQNVKSTETATEIPTKHSDGPATKESTGGSDKVSSVTDEYDSKSNTSEDVEIGAVTGKPIDKETTEQKSKITDRSDLSRATDDLNTGSVKERTKKSDPSSPPTIIPTVSRPITPDIGTASTKSFSPIPSTEDNRPVVASTTVYNEINSTNSSEKIGLSSRAVTTLPPTPEISTTENGNVMISDTEIPTTSTAHRQPAKVSTKESVDAETTSSTIGIIVTTPSQDPDVYGTSPEPTDTQIKDKSAVSVTPTKVSGSDEQKSEDVASTRVFSSTPPTMIPSGDTRTSKNPFTNSKPNVIPTTPKKKDSSVKTDEGASSKVPVDKSSDALTTFSNGPDPTSDVTKTSDEKSNPTIIPTTEPSKDTKKCDHDEVYKMLVLDICSDIVFGDDSSWKCNKVKNLHVLFNRLNH